MVKFDDRGLIPALIQDASTGDVLTLAYMNEEGLRRSLAGPDVWFFSRSRAELWHKGETSGNIQRVRRILVDCDSDTLLILVEPAGPACHTGNESCFFTPLEGVPEPADFRRSDPVSGVLDELFAVIQDRKQKMPAGSYTAELLAAGIGRVAQKVTEEAGETAISAAQGNVENLPEEVADLLYHTLVLMAASDVKPQQVWDVLRKRRG